MREDTRVVAERADTVVRCLDEPGAGGACHAYRVVGSEAGDDGSRGLFAHIKFQEGPIRENGVNGCTNEDLLEILIDRLEHFQTGSFPCRENQMALDSLYNALGFLDERTRNRIERGVEGVNLL